MPELKILVADDHNEFRAEMVGFLRKLKGVEVVGEARDGLEALVLAGELNPDVVMMDISMPGMGGLEATREIKGRNPRTKVVFVTIHEEKTYQLLAEVLQAEGYLCKDKLTEELPKLLQKMARENNMREVI